jgi:hypothetical protein
MVIAASIYLRFYIDVGVRVGTFFPTPTLTRPKIPSDADFDSKSTTPTPDATALPKLHLQHHCFLSSRQRFFQFLFHVIILEMNLKVLGVFICILIVSSFFHCFFMCHDLLFTV